MARRWKSPLGQAVGPVLAGIAFIAVLGLGLWGAAWLSTRGEVSANLTTDDLLKISTRAAQVDISKNGPRLTYVGKNRGYIYVNHLGADDDLNGWFAFDAVPANQPERCTAVWHPSERVFRSDCEPTVSYPADGTGLRQYEATANANTGQVIVDLNTRTAP